VDTAYSCGTRFGWAKANLESLNRAAVHASLLSLYGLGGWLVNKGLMPFRVLASAIGFTFSLTFATQGILGTVTEYQRMLGSIRR
jgi:ATP-binding cassette subfamily B (MDR/TAP) protein 10